MLFSFSFVLNSVFMHLFIFYNWTQKWFSDYDERRNKNFFSTEEDFWISGATSSKNEQKSIWFLLIQQVPSEELCTNISSYCGSNALTVRCSAQLHDAVYTLQLPSSPLWGQSATRDPNHHASLWQPDQTNQKWTQHQWSDTWLLRVWIKIMLTDRWTTSKTHPPNQICRASIILAKICVIQKYCEVALGLGFNAVPTKVVCDHVMSLK